MTDRRCIDCDLPIPYSTEPCVKCRQYACEKCSDPIEGICLACPHRAKEQEDLKLPVTYELLAKMIAESETRIRCGEREKREELKVQYRKELDQIREQVAELFNPKLEAVGDGVADDTAASQASFDPTPA